MRSYKRDRVAIACQGQPGQQRAVHGLAARQGPGPGPSLASPATWATAAAPMALPEQKLSRQPEAGHVPLHRGPCTSMTMWPSSAAAPLRPR